MDFKDIQINNKSSLVSLKAELARKQEQINTHNTPSIKNCPLKLKNEGVGYKNSKITTSNVNENISDLSQEEKELIDWSKDILAAKSKLYDKLCNKELVPEEKNSFLVNFDQKDSIEPTKNQLSEKIDDNSNNYETVASDSDDDEWVDYTDSLGRTRRCLRHDLEHYKKRDNDLNVQKNHSPVEEPHISEEFFSWDMKREELRKKWEEETIQLSQKKDIHYQDVLFNEARVHGVGYYKFSKDEQERKMQLEELVKIRKETEEQQKTMQMLKLRRETLMKSRLNAAKRRKRIRLGLPPEEENEPNAEIISVVSDEAEDKKAQEIFAEKIKENLDKIRLAAHIRPWDIGKDGVKTPVMTQEEWVESKRSERIEEFAPPIFKEDIQMISKKQKINDFHNIGVKSDTSNAESLCNNLSSSEEGIDVKLSSLSEDIILPKRKTNFFTTITPKNRNIVLNKKECSPIQFDDSDDDKPQKEKPQRVEIPPPLSYGQSFEKSSRLHSSNIKDSIEAGFNFIKQEVEIDEKKREKGFLK